MHKIHVKNRKSHIWFVREEPAELPEHTEPSGLLPGVKRPHWSLLFPAGDGDAARKKENVWRCVTVFKPKADNDDVAIDTSIQEEKQSIAL